MASDLRIELLGHFRVLRCGAPVAALGRPRLQALLAHLVLGGGAPRSRRLTAALFWPDSPEGRALTNLRQLLHHLQRELPEAEDCLAVDRGAVRWRPESGASVDVLELEAAWAESERAESAGDPAAAVAAARRGAGLYRGDLFPSCFEPWIEPDRRRLRELTLGGLQRLVHWLEEARSYPEAATFAGRLVELEPLREEGHRALIRLWALAGERARALEAYERCAALLEAELGTRPGPETRALRDRLVRAAGHPDEAAASRGERGSGHDAARWPLVGRGPEWERFRHRWERAAAGRASLLLVSGEAGIGKTHLLEAATEWVARQGFDAAQARCWAAEGALPFSPVAQWLRTGPLRERLRQLEHPWAREAARVAPDLGQEEAGGGPGGEASGGGDPPGGVGDPPSGLGDPPSGDGLERLRLFEGLARAVLAGEEPLLLALDDVQWCDGDTLQWLHYLLRFDARAPLLLLATRRSGEPGADRRFASWLLQLRQLEVVEEVVLAPLAPEETGALAAVVTGRAVGDEERTALHEETEGNPLFVVETLRSRGPADGAGAHEAGGAGAAPRERAAPENVERLPGRIRWVIRSRLEGLSLDTRRLVPLFAAVGRDFTPGLLRLAAPGEEDALPLAFDELVERQLLREAPDGSYDFTHDKIREVAYEEATAAHRSLLHERIARALERLHPERPERVAGEVARHLERAGAAEQAIPWRRMAAGHALGVHAYGDAAGHLEHALHVVSGLPEGPRRDERELDLQIALGVPLVAMDHYAGSRVRRCYGRALELCERLERPASPPVLRALALASLMRSELAEVVELGRRLMAAAERDADPMLGVEAHYVTGVALYWQGRLRPSREHLARALALYEPERAAAHLASFAQDPSIICGVRLALTEWQMGETSRAHARCLETLERAVELDHPFSLAYARTFGVWVLIECGDLRSARREAAAHAREVRTHDWAVWRTWGEISEGYLVAELGNVPAGLERMRAAMAEYEARELSLGFPYHQALHARACAMAGELEEGLAAIDRALGTSARTGERFWDAELHRLRGELLAAAGAPTGEVSECVRRAAGIASEQGAGALEARCREMEARVGL